MWEGGRAEALGCLAEQSSGGMSVGAQLGSRAALQLFPFQEDTELLFEELWNSSVTSSGALQACCVPWCFSMFFGEGVGSRTDTCGAVGTVTRLEHQKREPVALTPSCFSNPSYYAKLRQQEIERERELAEKYRDRAKERRDGVNKDYEETELISTTANYRAVGPTAEAYVTPRHRPVLAFCSRGASS